MAKVKAEKPQTEDVNDPENGQAGTIEGKTESSPITEETSGPGNESDATGTSKESTKNDSKDGKTVANALMKLGRAALGRNPLLEICHVTADGTVFASRNDAENHCRVLKNNTVVTVEKLKQ